MRSPSGLGHLFVIAAGAAALSNCWAYDIDLGPIGHVCDTCGGGVIGGIPIVGHVMTETEAQAGGLALEQWINISRNNSIGGAAPIPPDIRQRLTGYATEDSMNRVRYKIGDGGFANLAERIEKAGQAAAVTLNDLIIFLGPSEAQDPSLWAHELTHVQQYSSWGVHDFAIRYVRDSNAVENEAYARGGQNYWNWWNASHGAASQPIPAPGPFGPLAQPVALPPPLWGAFCNTPIGRFGPGALQPVGAGCFITTPGGLLGGSIVQ